MGFQPSAFDFTAGDPAWSPYWDHWTYAWKDGVEPRLLASQTAIHEARCAGALDEFPGVPDTNGEIFTVNCPVPVLAPNTFEPARRPVVGGAFRGAGCTPGPHGGTPGSPETPMAVPDPVDAVTKVGDAVPALMLRDGDGNAVALA